VFVDEVGDLPASIQVKLLRVIEQREVLRVGSLKPRAIDVRFIAATNRDLEAEVALGRFRPDLFFRLNGIALVIPPLRDRVSEIAGLAEQFVARACVAAARPPPRLAPEALALLEGYGWPGNVRELRNLMERAVLLCSGDTIQPEHLPADKMAPAFFALGARPSLVPSLARPRPARPSGGFDDHPTPAPGELTRAARAAAAAVDDERARITAALERCGGNQTRAAKLLGISRGTLVARLKEFGLARPRKTDDSD